MLRAALHSLVSGAVRWQGPLAALLYGVCSTTMAFVNKAVLSSYNFNFPFFILSLQMALTIAVLELLCWRRLLSLPRYTLQGGLSFLWPSLFCGLHGALSLYALHGLNIPMYGALKRCTPLVNLVLSVTLLRKGAPSLLLAASILVITSGCFIAALGDLTYDPAAYTLGLLSVLAQGLYLTLVQRHSEVTGASSFLILQLNSYNSLLPFVLLSFAAGEPFKAISMSCWNDPRFVMLFTLLVVLGCVFTYSLFVCTSVNSALTTSLVGVAKSTIQTVLGFFTFGGVKYHPLNIAGIGINTVGGFLYAYAKYSEKRAGPRVLKDQNLNIVHESEKERLLGPHRLNGLPRIIASADTSNNVTDNGLIETSFQFSISLHFEEVVKDANGRLLLESVDVRKRWAEYCKLLNVEDVRDTNTVAVGGDTRMPVVGARNVSDIAKEEVQEAMDVMKAGKAPGLDDVATECL